MCVIEFVPLVAFSERGARRERQQIAVEQNDRDACGLVDLFVVHIDDPFLFELEEVQVAEALFFVLARRDQKIGVKRMERQFGGFKRFFRLQSSSPYFALK